METPVTTIATQAADQFLNREGVLGSVIALLLAAIWVLWRELQKERAARIRDIKTRNRWKAEEPGE